MDFSLKYDISSDTILEAYIDAYLASDPEDRKSMTDYIIYFFGNPIVWRTKKQSLIVLGSCDAECVAVLDGIQGINYIWLIVSDIFETEPPVVIVHEDNSSTIRVAQMPLRGRSRAIDTRIKYVQQAEMLKQIHLEKIKGSEQIADLFTKSLDEPKLTYYRDKIFKVF